PRLVGKGQTSAVAGTAAQPHQAATFDIPDGDPQPELRRIAGYVNRPETLAEGGDTAVYESGAAWSLRFGSWADGVAGRWLAPAPSSSAVAPPRGSPAAHSSRSTWRRAGS